MTTAQIIDGKTRAAELRARVATIAQALAARHLTPGLAVVIVGEDPASRIYVSNKVKFAREVGFHSLHFTLSADIAEKDLLLKIEGLNDDPAVHGILVQLPLPRHIDAQKVIETIQPDKDVDGFHPINAGRLSAGGAGLVPCTPLGCLMLLRDYFAPETMTGKHAVVVGRSNIVGKPMAQLLLRENCTVTVCHSHTADLRDHCRRADILVAAVGRSKMIGANWIKPGAAVLDVGMNRETDKATGKARLSGDVDFEAVRAVAGAITPVPGGVGPMTIACLLRNTLAAAALQTDIDIELP